MGISDVISRNLTAWMAESPDLRTFKAVAARSGVGFGTVQRAKNGSGNVTIENLDLIARAFRRSVTELLQDEPAPGALSHYPAASAPIPLHTHETAIKGGMEEEIRKINELLRQMNEFGRVVMLEKAKEVVREYPLRADKTAS